MTEGGGEGSTALSMDKAPTTGVSSPTVSSA